MPDRPNALLLSSRSRIFIGAACALRQADAITLVYRNSISYQWSESGVEIGQVEAFLAVGTFGGFRRAGDALNVTQPAVSARIKALEASLGVALFERGRGGLSLS
ncbi:MAG: LysR family transcriptional regulator, partial [candidate division NC10 bacterium]